MGESYLDDPDVRRMLRVREGDPEAFEELVGAYAPALVAFVRRFVGRHGPAEDIAQEVFLRVHRAAASYEPTARFRTWIFTIASNLCLNERRRLARHAHLSLDDPVASPDGVGRGATLAGGGAAPEERMDRNELRDRVRSAVEALPDNQRMAIVLARWEQLSYQEIGAAMGLSVMAVKSLMNRAKNNLKKALDQEIRDFLVVRPEDA